MRKLRIAALRKLRADVEFTLGGNRGNKTYEPTASTVPVKRAASESMLSVGGRVALHDGGQNLGLLQADLQIAPSQCIPFINESEQSRAKSIFTDGNAGVLVWKGV